MRAPGPPLQALFNDPTIPGDRALEAKLEEFLASAPAGATVRATFYHLTRLSPAQALVAAQARGVNVQVVLDKDNRNAAYDVLKAGLPAANLTLCTKHDGGCIGSGINHNKFVLFSELTDGSKNVVWQSSANLTNSQLEMHNNTVVVRDDAVLYEGYRKYFDDLRAQRANPNYYRTFDGAGATTRAFVFPRASSDTVVNLLDNVRCERGHGSLRVVMAFFTNARVAVAKKLASLKRAGCSVETLLNEGDDAGPNVLAALRAGGVTVRRYPRSIAAIHSKYLLLDSIYDGEPRTLVFTGSHNYTGAALRSNDEVLLRVDDPTVFAAFEADYAKIRTITR
jgi:phosphatidylserine/phosphatidylglycerophosphate/cardiolipin synthase-like enzyme